MKQIILATKNEGKIKEITQIINKDFAFKTCRDFPDWPYIQESGQTFLENALLKAKGLAQKYNLPAIADDSGLEVKALGDRPGVNSSRYAGPEQDDSKNIAKLLEEMLHVGDKRARFVTIAVFYRPDGSYETAEGEVRGQIIRKPIGTGGFGYDPVFKPEGYDRAMAELSLEEKNAISHRGKAFRKLASEIGSQYI